MPGMPCQVCSATCTDCVGVALTKETAYVQGPALPSTKAALVWQKDIGMHLLVENA